MLPDRIELARRFGSLLNAHLETVAGPKSLVKVSKSLSEVLPLSDQVIRSHLGAYCRGEIYYPPTTSHAKMCLSYSDKMERRSQILYALGVEEDSELISVLRDLDSRTVYPPLEQPEQISPLQIKTTATLYQKIKGLSEPRRAEVEELVERLYADQIRE
ncbi:MAG: hypothetical protein WCV90_02600 [Candidatus Woesearchaeota archaeon]|jgi:hypothetical protein